MAILLQPLSMEHASVSKGRNDDSEGLRDGVTKSRSVGGRGLV